MATILKMSTFPSLPPPSPFHTALSESMIQETLQNSESLITKWKLKPPSTTTKPISLFLTDRSQGREFIISVQNLRKVMHYYLSQNSASHSLVQSQTLMQIAMDRLEHEFYSIISSTKQNLDPESVSSRSSNSNSNKEDDESDEKVDSLSAMTDLKAIAECMIRGGYGKECVRIYGVLRKSIVEEELFKIGIERLKSSQVQKMDGVVLDQKVKKWLVSMKNAITKVFQRERILCDHVFSASDSIRESCLAETTTEGAITVFRFAEIVAKKRRSADRIFRLMEMHKAITDLWPEIESVFTFESTAVVRSQALSSLVRLSDSVRLLMSEFESTIQKDSSKKLVLGGGIHPLTPSSMNYIALLADYSLILSDIVCDWPYPVTKSQLPESYFDSPKSDESPSTAVAVRLAWLILVLLCKLDNKAGVYKNVSLSYLFMANNLNLIVEKVRATNLRHLLGQEWVTSHQNKVKQYALNYETTAWSKVISSLPTAADVSLSPDEAREYFMRFNYAFEEAYKNQKSWIVIDRQLRDEMKVSLAKKLVIAYSQFYHENVLKLNGETNIDLLVKFGPDDLGNYLSDLFHGVSAASSNKPRFRSV